MLSFRSISRTFPFRLRFMSTSMPAEKQQPLLALPSTAEATVQQVDVNDTFKLKELGPVVVNVDGTISRINNWHEMSDIEKDNVNRILLIRNRQRLAKLKKEREEQEGQQ
ncbi:hypothetical protein BX666DRAFT_1974859 [Dichotomocladium elegans]|nr:hypothetical protein BX666DRAFT_1974859 [Dichotomocladium elegans]